MISAWVQVSPITNLQDFEMLMNKDDFPCKKKELVRDMVLFTSHNLIALQCVYNKC